LKLVIVGVLLLALLPAGVVAGSASHCMNEGYYPSVEKSPNCAVMCDQLMNTACAMTADECHQVSGSCMQSEAPICTMPSYDGGTVLVSSGPESVSPLYTATFPQPTVYSGCTMELGAGCGQSSTCMIQQSCTGIDGCEMTSTGNCYDRVIKPVLIEYATMILPEGFGFRAPVSVL
jgi:hypothetical protein